MCKVALEVFSQREPTQELAEIVTELGRIRCDRIGDYTGAEDWTCVGPGRCVPAGPVCTRVGCRPSRQTK